MSFELTHIPAVCERNARETERRLRVALLALEHIRDLAELKPCRAVLNTIHAAAESGIRQAEWGERVDACLPVVRAAVPEPRP